MQTNVSTEYLNSLKQDVSLQGKARLIAEWNQNRFAGPATVVCTGFPDATSDEFPIESVVSPNRPQKEGLLKARASNRNKYLNDLQAEGYVQSQYDNTTTARTQRSYTVSKNAKYKYWTSPTRSAAVASGGTYALTSGNVLEVTYTKAVWMNKVALTFEASVVSPSAISVAYKTSQNGSWTAWAGSHSANADGRVDLYRQANGTMSTTENFDAPLKIWGLRVTVGALSRPNAYLNVVEISARLVQDLSDYLMEYSTEMTLSDTSMVTPLGVCSSNVANVTLDNIDGRFDTDRVTLRDSAAENLYYGLIDKNVRMTMDLGILVNGSYEYTRAFTMWVDEWSSINEITSEISLKDSSKFLQEDKPTSFLHVGFSNPTITNKLFKTSGMTASQVVWRLCDSVGFNNYVIDTSVRDKLTMDYFWTDPEKTVWDHLKEIAEATQTAIFFDEYDQLRVLPRDAAYNLGRAVTWIFDAEEPDKRDNTGRTASDAAKIPDIVESPEQTLDYEANAVNVRYSPTSVSEMVRGIAKMESVWEPEGTVTLRASRLFQNFSSTDQSFKITPSEAVLWPYTGVVQMEGEFIRYTKKGYTYRDSTNVWRTAYITTEDERKARDAETPAGMSFQNYFNGYFWCGTEGRGLWGSVAKTHLADAANYAGRTRTLNGTVKLWNGGMVHNKTNGTMQLNAPKTSTTSSWYVVSRGNSGDAAPIYYGTRLRMPTSGYGYGAAGLATNLGTNDSGYFVEIVKTSAITAGDRAKWTNELCFYKRDTAGNIKRIGPNGGKGIPVEIIAGKWYDLDVKIYIENGYHTIGISLNGVTKMTVTIPGGEGLPLAGRFGVFTRGWTTAEFEYLYANTQSINDTLDEPGWFDQIQGGYQSSQVQREWIYGQRLQTFIRSGRPAGTVSQRFTNMFFDEFGPVVHEVREYDVKFEKKPVIHSTLYLSNDSQAICPEYIGTPFGAKFVLANLARRNIVVNGEDTVTFGADNSVEQKLMIYGRMVERGEEQTVTEENIAAINLRGRVEVDIASNWIQNKQSAESIAKWITYHWGGGTDEVRIQCFGNPLLQLGDLVAVHDPDNSMLRTTHRYFIVSIEHSFNGSLSTTVTLRRAK